MQDLQYLRGFLDLVGGAVCAPLTRLGYFRDWNVLFISHEAKDGENGETRHETGAAVQKAQRQTVPATQAVP